VPGVSSHAEISQLSRQDQSDGGPPVGQIVQLKEEGRNLAPFEAIDSTDANKHI